MYLHLGQEVVVRHADIIGVFDLDNTTVSPHTREFLHQAEMSGNVTYVSMDLPKSFTVCAPKGHGHKEHQIYIAQMAPSTLRKRAENGNI